MFHPLQPHQKIRKQPGNMWTWLLNKGLVISPYALLAYVCLLVIWAIGISIRSPSNHAVESSFDSTAAMGPQVQALFRDCPNGYKLRLCHRLAMPDLKKLANSPYKIPICVNEDKYTVILLTHGENRIGMMMESLANYARLKRVHKVIVLWNNGDLKPPDTSKLRGATVPITFVPLKENRLTLRFQPLEEIETQGVFGADDDLVIPERNMDEAFHVWKKHAYGIVGFQDHTRGHLSANGTFSYVFRPSNYSISLTGAAFHHKEYLRMFTETLPQNISDFIHKTRNCEDIAMNMVISDHCSCGAALHIQEQLPLTHIAQVKNISGLGARVNTEQVRSGCIRQFSEYFKGGMPLKQTPCLYGDSHINSRKWLRF